MIRQDLAPRALLACLNLDECHGRASQVLWEGKEVNMYHYVLTSEYPYTIGCFRGTSQRLQARLPPGAKAGGPPPKGGPPSLRNPGETR